MRLSQCYEVWSRSLQSRGSWWEPVGIFHQVIFIGVFYSAYLPIKFIRAGLQDFAANWIEVCKMYFVHIVQKFIKIHCLQKCGVFFSHIKIVAKRYQTLVTFFFAIWGKQPKKDQSELLLPVLKFIHFLLFMLFLFDLANNRPFSFMKEQIPEWEKRF